jgi:hypothetical protein
VTSASPPPRPQVQIRLLAGLVVPVIAFVVLLQVVGNATGALAITDAIPVLWLIAFGIWRRRIEPVGLVAVVVFAIALVATIAFGGSSLPLELRRAVFPGAVGLACLISIAAGHPLLLVVSTRALRARPEQAGVDRPDLDSPGARRSLTIVTAIFGVTFVADAAAQIVLALTVSTATFGVVARIASYVIIGSGLAVVFLYARVTRARLRRSSEVEQKRGPEPAG